MKKVILMTVAAIGFWFGGMTQTYSFENLKGNWRNKQGAGLEIVDSSKLYVVYKDHKKQLVNYAVDFSSNPAVFNFVLKEQSGTVNVKSMLLFINDDLIQWQVMDGDSKPVNYNTSKKDIVVLRKVEERSN